MKISDSTPIKTVDKLQQYLQVAIQIEHATIPVYLTTLYSIKAEASNVNKPSADIIREVVIEEMLHLTLAANMLNAIGGAPDLLADGFVQRYPTRLPTGERDFKAELKRFSRETITDVFLKIERPSHPTDDKSLIKLDDVCYIKHEDLEEGRKGHRGIIPHFPTTSDSGEKLILHFRTIGDFYRAILNGFEKLYAEMGDDLFSGDVNRQVDPEYYYSSGGDLLKVTDIKTARDAIKLISGQGEGFPDQIYDEEGELSHYYRFDQIVKGRYYVVATDKKGEPTGIKFKVDWDAVYPIIENATADQYPEGSDVHHAALKFNRCYWNFLAKLNRGFNGNTSEFKTIYKDMFQLRDAANRLMRNPLPSGEGNAAPTFEMDQLSPE